MITIGTIVFLACFIVLLLYALEAIAILLGPIALLVCLAIFPLYAFWFFFPTIFLVCGVVCFVLLLSYILMYISVLFVMRTREFLGRARKHLREKERTGMTVLNPLAVIFVLLLALAVTYFVNGSSTRKNYGTPIPVATRRI